MSYINLDFYCGDCDAVTNETVERPAPPSFPCEVCGQLAERCLSAVRFKQQLVTVNRGKSQERPSPLAMNTEPLADGMSYHRWRKERDKVFDEHRRKRIKARLG